MKLTQKLGFPIAILILLVAWFAPVPGMDELTRRALGLMFFTVALWITRPVTPALSALLFMVLAWALDIVPSEVAFSGFSNRTTWFVWGALTMALAVKETGLGLRLARFLATKTPGSSKGMLGSYHVLSFLMTYLVPSAVAKVSSLAPIAASQVETLGLPLKSKTGKTLMLSLVSINSYVGGSLLSGGSGVVTVWGVLAGLGIEISWIQWWLYMIAPMLVAVAVNYLVNIVIFKPEPAQMAEGAGVKEIAKAELAELGPMSTSEKKAAAIISATVLLWATEPFHGLDSAMVCCFCGIALCFPGIGVLTAREALVKVNWGTVIFTASALSVGAMTESTGVAEILTHLLSFILTIGGNEYTFLLMMIVTGFIGRLTLRSVAASAAVLLAPMVLLAQSLGYHPAYVGMLFDLTLCGIFTYQYSYGLIAYDYGTFEEPDFMLASLARYAAIASFITFAYFVWWPLVGV